MRAASLGFAAGIGMGFFAVFFILWYVFQAIADWKILSKAGKPGWHSFIPILNVVSEYDICWSGAMGLVFQVAVALNTGLSQSESRIAAAISAVFGIVAAVLHIVQSIKLSKAFGKGVGFGIFLILFGPLARLVLGLGGSYYVGKQ